MWAYSMSPAREIGFASDWRILRLYAKERLQYEYNFGHPSSTLADGHLAGKEPPTERETGHSAVHWRCWPAAAGGLRWIQSLRAVRGYKPRPRKFTTQSLNPVSYPQSRQNSFNRFDAKSV